jgi:hypothetical protein
MAAQLATAGEQSGHLLKLGSRVRTWKRRFFVLRPATYLYYYLSSGDDEPAGCVNLDLYSECFDVADEEFADRSHHTPVQPPLLHLHGPPAGYSSSGVSVGGYESGGEGGSDYEVGRGVSLTPPPTPKRSARAEAEGGASTPAPPPPHRPWGALPPLPGSGLASGGSGNRGYRSAKGWVTPKHAAALERHQASSDVSGSGHGHGGSHGSSGNGSSGGPGARALRLRRPDTGQELVLVARSVEEAAAWRCALGAGNTHRGLKAHASKLEAERLELRHAVFRLQVRWARSRRVLS